MNSRPITKGGAMWRIRPSKYRAMDDSMKSAATRWYISILPTVSSTKSRMSSRMGCQHVNAFEGSKPMLLELTLMVTLVLVVVTLNQFAWCWSALSTSSCSCSCCCCCCCCCCRCYCCCSCSWSCSCSCSCCCYCCYCCYLLLLLSQPPPLVRT